MAKKYRNHSRATAPLTPAQSASPVASPSDAAHIKTDLIQTVVVNLVFLALLLGLHQWNAQNGDPLSSWISGII